MKYYLLTVIFVTTQLVMTLYADEDVAMDEDDFSDFGPQHKHRNDPTRWNQFYIQRIFEFYGIDYEHGEQMGETILAKLMFDLSLLVTHEIVKVEESGHDDHGEEDDTGSDDHDSHDRRKREVTGLEDDHDHGLPIELGEKISDSISSIPHGHSVSNGSKCMDAQRLLDEYNLHYKVSKDKGIATYELGLLCPAFIDTILRKSCVKEIHRDHVHLLHIKHPHSVREDHIHKFRKQIKKTIIEQRKKKTIKHNPYQEHGDNEIESLVGRENNLHDKEAEDAIFGEFEEEEHELHEADDHDDLDLSEKDHNWYQEEYCICGTKHVHDDKESPPAGQVWGWGFLAITVISLLSFLGAALIPIIAAHFFDTLLSILVSSAVGALAGDALLHLLPHSQGGGHDHSNRGVYSNLTGLAGIYLLFVMEGFMKIFHAQKERKQRKGKLEMQNGGTVNSRSSRKELEVDFDAKNDDEAESNSIEKRSETDQHDPSHQHGHAHDHGDMTEKSIASVAWMVIAGDGMHNFSDGVAIGAAFSRSIVGGLSTSVAVFCHELPHELGDFAMLLKAGMSVKQALFYNAVAACLGYLGLVIGILIGKYASDVTPWIFALTAGMFLYVGLVDMLPEINPANGGGSLGQMLIRFLLQNFGLLVGITIMLLIALFEDNIDFS